MAELKWSSECIRWMEDWRREDAEPWMLVNLVDALKQNSGDAEALQVIRHALTLPPDHSHKIHCVCLAVEDACRGEIDSARRLLEEIPPNSLDANYAFYEKMARAVVEAARGEAGNMDAVIPRVNQFIKDAVSIKGNFNHNDVLRRIFFQCLQAISQRIGRWKGKRWYIKCMAASYGRTRI